jgi:hypothetical protein
VSIRTWDGSIVAKATTACGFRTVRVGKRSSARLFNASSTACRFDCRKPVHRRDTSSVIDAKLSTASLCENPAVLRAQLRISGFTLGMETFWHAKGGARVFLSTLRIRRLPTRRFGHRGYAATREAAMAAFGSRGGASGPLADFDLEALAPVCPKNEGAYYPFCGCKIAGPQSRYQKRGEV